MLRHTYLITFIIAPTLNSQSFIISVPKPLNFRHTTHKLILQYLISYLLLDLTVEIRVVFLNWPHLFDYWLHLSDHGLGIAAVNLLL